MEAKREQAWVGLFVVIATGLLLFTVFKLSGVVGGTQMTYKVRFRNAAGLQPGAQVDFAGTKVGRVEEMRIDSEHGDQIEFVLKVKKGTPVKTDSLVKIISFSALGESIVNIEQGSPGAQTAADGSWLRSEEFFGLPQVADALKELKPKVEATIDELKARIVELKETIARVNELLGPENRDNVSASLKQVRGLLDDNRKPVRDTIANLRDRSAEIKPLIEEFKKTAEDARKAINNVDGLVVENRETVKASIAKLRGALDKAESLLSQLDRTMNYNAENIDEIMENIRITTENLKQFTEVIKTHPSTLIRSPGRPDRKPGQAPPKN